MDKIIHCQARLRCSPERAFDYFTDEKLLESWLCLKAEVEAEIGGRYFLFWEPDDRENNSTLGCRITALEKPNLLAFEWRGPKQFKHFANDADPLTHGAVFFLPVSEGTDVHVLHTGWRSSPEWEEHRVWQENAWKYTLKALQQQAIHE